MVFQPTEPRLENDEYWPKVLTATPICESILASISGHFKHLPQQGTVFIDLLLREYEHTITLPLRLYESFRLIFNAIQRHGTRMPRKLNLSELSFTETALLHQAATFLKMAELEDRLRDLLENWEISDTEVRTLLASVPIDDLAVKLLINNLARLYMHSLQCQDSDTIESIKELLRRARSSQFTFMFKGEIKRRQARDCGCKKEYCCGEQGCCIHAQRSGLYVAEDGDDNDPDDADKAGRVSYERARPVQREIQREFGNYKFGNEYKYPAGWGTKSIEREGQSISNRALSLMTKV